MEEKSVTFRLVSGRVEVIASPLTELRWRIIRSTSSDPGGKEPIPWAFKSGDEVCAQALIPWKLAKKRVAPKRTRVSPRSLVLLKGFDEEKPESEEEIRRLIEEHPWPDPTRPKPAA